MGILESIIFSIAISLTVTILVLVGWHNYFQNKHYLKHHSNTKGNGLYVNNYSRQESENQQKVVTEENNRSGIIVYSKPAAKYGYVAKYTIILGDESQTYSIAPGAEPLFIELEPNNYYTLNIEVEKTSIPEWIWLYVTWGMLKVDWSINEDFQIKKGGKLKCTHIPPTNPFDSSSIKWQNLDYEHNIFFDNKKTAIANFDVFISYATGDSLTALELKEALEKNGLKCFMAEKDIQVAAEWQNSIRDALDGSKRVLVLLTPRSVSRPWVLMETGAAWALTKPLIPALVHVATNELPEPMRKHQARVIETTAQRKALVEELTRT